MFGFSIIFVYFILQTVSAPEDILFVDNHPILLFFPMEKLAHGSWTLVFLMYFSSMFSFEIQLLDKTREIKTQKVFSLSFIYTDYLLFTLSPVPPGRRRVTMF